MGRPVHPHIITPDSALGGKDIVRSLRFKSDDNTSGIAGITITGKKWFMRSLKMVFRFIKEPTNNSY